MFVQKGMGVAMSIKLRRFSRILYSERTHSWVIK